MASLSPISGWFIKIDKIGIIFVIKIYKPAAIIWIINQPLIAGRGRDPENP
jgi:hypothetical protein